MTKKINTPAPSIFKEHIEKYFRSLLPYKEHIRPAMDKRYGPVWPEFLAYLCPLCLQNLLVLTSEGLAGTSEFNMDHFPPECVGGRSKVIVCEKCNNTAGSKFEPELIAYLNQQSYNLKVKGATVKCAAVLYFKGQTRVPGKYRVKLTMTEEGTPLFDFGSLYKIPLVAEWLEYMQRNPKDWKVELTMQNPDYGKVSRALQKAAYLYCFSLWGYEFVFSENAEKLRHVIEGKLEYPHQNGCTYFLSQNVNLIPPGVAFIARPETHKHLVVNIPLAIKEINFNGIAGMLIPSPTANGWEEMIKFRLSIESVDIRSLLPFDINTQLNGYTQAWENITSGTVKEVLTNS